MAYVTYTNVRTLTNLSVSDISDNDLTNIIAYATVQLNHDVTTEVIRERIDYIDSTRENKIDGLNTTYYVKNWEGKYISDRDDDGDVDTSDITVVKVASDGTESSVAVATITPNSGKFTVSSAVSSDYTMYVSYKWSYADTSTPGSLVEMACILLSAAYAHSKLNWGSSPSVSFGNTRILRHMDAFDKFYRQYLKIVNQINNKMAKMSEAAGT